MVRKGWSVGGWDVSGAISDVGVRLLLQMLDSSAHRSDSFAITVKLPFSLFRSFSGTGIPARCLQFFNSVWIGLFN